MIAPIIWQISHLRLILEHALKKVYRYQSQLQEYSESTTPMQRRSDVESVRDDLNVFASEFAASGALPSQPDVRVLFGLWSRLDAWHDYLSSQNQEDYMTVMNDHQVFGSPMAFLLQPIQHTDRLPEHRIIPVTGFADFLAAFASGIK